MRRLPIADPTTARRSSVPPEPPDSVVVLDFGSQFAQLIARRVRELDVYSELLPVRHDRSTSWSGAASRASSSRAAPTRSTTSGAPKPDPAIWSGRLPVLGICYGAQLMAMRARRRRHAHAEA